jgi:hypothetical protein
MSDIETKLIALARWAIEEHRKDCADLDGGSIQDKLEELKLIERVTVTEPCGENCSCAEYVGPDGFPTDCLRLVDGVQL